MGIPEIQTINIAVYRPPKTKKQVFDKVLNELEKLLKNVEKSKQTIIISGDFNFPFVSWKRMENGGCIGNSKSVSNATTDEKLQFNRLNDIRMVADIDVNTSAISDHNEIEITTTYRIKEEKINKKKQDTDNTVRSLNFHAEKNISWKK